MNDRKAVAKRKARASKQMAGVCWARAGFPPCDGGLSGEHVISDKLFSESMIQVAGEPWASGIELRTMGKGRLRRRILCVRHNGLLSPADSEAIRTFNVIADHDDNLAAARRAGAGYQGAHRVNGLLLERWFLKTAINLFIVRKATWATPTQAGTAPDEFVAAAYGLRPLDAPRGLYSAYGELGDTVRVRKSLEIRPHYNGTGAVAGARFIFRGLTFILWLSPEPLPWPSFRQCYRHVGLELRDGDGVADLSFDWPPVQPAKEQ